MLIYKGHVAFTPGTVFGSNGEGFVRIVMSADEKVINKCFKKLESAGVRFDTPKSQLPLNLQKDIEEMTNGSYSMESKADRDFKEYMNTLSQKQLILQDRLKDKESVLQKLIPQPNTELPWNILKDEQFVYLQNVLEGKALFGQIKDIPPYSNPEEYTQIANDIKTQWLERPYPQAEILPPYKSGTFYPDAYYFTIKTEDNRLQALANIEIQKDGIAWGRSLNTAPWNQGQNGEIRGAGKAIIARMVTFCLETGNDKLRFATNKPENIKLYKNIGMAKIGTRNFGGEIHTVLEFDKKAMQLFLNKYQINLSF